MSDQRRFAVSAWAIRNPIPIVVLFVAAVLAGLVAYAGLAIKNYPNIEFPAVLVSVTRSGAAPAEMESQITRPVENALAGLSNIESISSTVTEGVSSTFVQFQLGQNLQKATRCPLKGRSDSQRPAARHRPAHHPAPGDRRTADRHLRRR